MSNTSCDLCKRMTEDACFVIGYHSEDCGYEPVTFGDRIRAMDNKELAEYLSKITGTQKRNTKRWLKRLRQPA